jgi:hypothetical protein
VLSGLITVLSGNHFGSSASAAVCGVAFAILFFIAVALRPGIGMDPVRATLGVVSVGLLLACFLLAVGALDTPSVADIRTQLIRAAAGAGLVTLGMAVVAAIIPSAVAAGLAVLGLAGTVLLSCVAAGMSFPGLLVAGLVAAVAAFEVGLRLPWLRAHPSATVWTVNVAAALIGAAGTALALSFNGLAVAAAGLVGAALAVLAWRWRAVLAAIAATVALLFVETYVVLQAVGSDPTSQGVILLLSGLVMLMVVGITGMRLRGRVRAARTGGVLPEEIVLSAAVVLGLLALTDIKPTGSPFQRLPIFGAPGGQEQPSFEPFSTPLPTIPPS